MKLRWLGLALIFCAVTGAAHAKQEQKPEFRFAAILSDNMVLQQQKKAEHEKAVAEAKKEGKPVVHRGNTYQEMKKRDGKIYLFFDSDPVVYDKWKHIENNAYWQVLPCAREGNAEFQGFIIAGSDQRWYPATARHAKLDGKCCSMTGWAQQ